MFNILSDLRRLIHRYPWNIYLKKKQTKNNQNTLTASQNINTSNDVNTLAGEAAPNVTHSHNASIVNHFSRKEANIHPKLLIYYAYVVM